MKSLPCPYCGDEPKIEKFGKKDSWFAACSNSQCPKTPTTKSAKNKEYAIAQWNTLIGKINLQNLKKVIFK